MLVRYVRPKSSFERDAYAQERINISCRLIIGSVAIVPWCCHSRITINTIALRAVTYIVVKYFVRFLTDYFNYLNEHLLQLRFSSKF